APAPCARSAHGARHSPPPGPSRHADTMTQATPPIGAPVGAFAQLLSSTRRGARLARRLAVAELRSWGVSQALMERAELVVAELTANAVLHGRVPGRCSRLTLALRPAAGRLRLQAS